MTSSRKRKGESRPCDIFGDTLIQTISPLSQGEQKEKSREETSCSIEHLLGFILVVLGRKGGVVVARDGEKRHGTSGCGFDALHICVFCILLPGRRGREQT
jgi:hypothetical protein